MLAGLVAVQACAGAVGIATGAVDFGPRVTAMLPFGSSLLAAVALVIVVAGPMTVATWCAITGHPRTGPAMAVAGTLLIGWIVVQVAVIQAFSWLQPAMGAAGVVVLVFGMAHSLRRLDRWMYRGGRPNRLARFLNRSFATVATAGLLPHRMATLAVTGRRTGRTITFPVVVADLAGERYLVSMLGEGNWVRNVRAADGHAVLRHGRHGAIRLTEVEPGDRAAVLRRYLAVAPGARAHVPVDRHAPLAEFDRPVGDIPMFRIGPMDTP